MSGLTATYFDDVAMTDPVVTRIDPAVDFRWGKGSPAPGVGRDTFSVRWEGTLTVPDSGQYRFNAPKSGDGFRLWIDGKPLINRWGRARDGARTATTGVTQLEAGEPHDVRIEYFDRKGAASARLLWDGPDAPKEVVPQEQLAPAAPAPLLPTAPTEVRATAVSSSRINVQWNLVDGATGYQVQRRIEGSDEWTTVAERGRDGTLFEDTGLRPATLYAYRVRSTSEVGTSAWSEPVRARTAAEDEPERPRPEAPAAPTGLEATAVSSRQINVRWNDVDGEAGYRLERRRAGSDEWVRLAELDRNVTEYQDTRVDAGVTYVYRVRAFNAAGPSPYSNTDEATTPSLPEEPRVPAAPTDLRAQAVSPTRINLRWNDVAGETEYRLERRRAGVDEQWTVIPLGANVTEYADQSVSPGTEYVYRIRGVNDAGASPYSNLASARTPSPEAPLQAPTELRSLAVSTSQINLRWNDVAGEAGYQIERRRAGVDAPWEQIAVTGENATEYQDKGLPAGTAFVYRVRAFRGDIHSAYSNVADARTFSEEQPRVPTAPAELRALAVSSSQIDLSWRDSSGETGYRVERRRDGSSAWELVAEIDQANVTSYQDRGLPAGTTFIYRVRAVNSAGPSPYSNPAAATTFASNETPT